MIELEVKIGEDEFLKYEDLSFSKEDNFGCYFTFNERSKIIETINKLVLPELFGRLINLLFTCPGVYIEYNENGLFKKHGSFLDGF